MKLTYIILFLLLFLLFEHLHLKLIFLIYFTQNYFPSKLTLNYLSLSIYGNAYIIYFEN